MFDKTLNAFSKFATLGRNARPGKDRKRRASIGALTFAADDTNNDRDDTRSKTLQRSTAIDLNSDVVLQLNKGLMRRSQSTESLNISLHQTWRTIDIDIDSPPSPVNDYEENPYQDLNVLPLSRNNEGNNSHAESESGSDQDVEAIEINNDFQCSTEGENLYEDTDFVREVLNSSRLAQVETVRASRTQVEEPQGVPDNGIEGTTTTITTSANSPNQNHSADLTHVQVGALNTEKVINLDKSSNIKESQSDDDNTPIDDECDTDNEYHDTVVKDLNVIEISEQGIVSRLRTSEPEEGPREEGVDGDITESMDNYFQRMGIMRVDDDEEEEEEEEEEEIEEDGIKSKRQLDEIEQELHVDENMEDNEEAMLELNEVLNKFEMIEEDTRKDIKDIDTRLVIHTETKTKPKLLPKPKPKPPLKPKPLLRPAKSLGTLDSSGTKKVGAIVTSFECESLPNANVQLQAPSLVTKSSPDKMKQSCDIGRNENVHKPGSGSMSSDGVRPKEIASKLTAIFAIESAMRPVKPPPLSPKPSPPVLGGTGGFVGKSRFDSECEFLHSGTDLSCSSEQSSGTGSIGTPSLLPLPVQLPSPCVLPEPWSDQSSMTSNEGPNCSISSSEDFTNEQQHQFGAEDDGDDNIINNDNTSRIRAGTKVGAKGRGRQVSQRWQRNHLKKVSAQLQSGGGVKRTFNKIQNAENLKRFSNYLANKRPSLDLLSEPIQR